MKKKIVVAMMAVTLALGAVACGEKAPIAPATQESSTEATAEATDKADEAASKESVDAADEATSDASAEASSEATSEEAGKSSEFTSGVIKDNVYENEFFNVKCPVLDGMKYGDEAKLEQVNGNVTDVLSNDKLKKSVENGTSVIVAYAEDSNTGTTFNVSITSAGKIATTVLDDKTIIEASKDALVGELEGAGFTDVTTEVGTVKFLGEDHTALVVNAKVQGVPFSEKLACILKDGYVATFTGASLSEDELDSIFELSSKLN
ncbi:MAG: hypothetical protein IKZ97_03265 [Butyrivibrio sp.]|nr:hypothetical protein [Butyrivibrio sp.]